MKVVGVDERIYQLVGSDPTFVVMLFDGGDQPYEGDVRTSWAEDTYQLTDCGILDAIRWAQDNILPGGAWSVGLVEMTESPEDGRLEPGLTYLEGYDLNVSDNGLSDWQGRQLDEMVARIGKTVVLPATSTTVWPNGTAATPYTGGSVTWTSD